jgi:hypothetical protein
MKNKINSNTGEDNLQSPGYSTSSNFSHSIAEYLSEYRRRLDVTSEAMASQKPLYEPATVGKHLQSNYKYGTAHPSRKAYMLTDVASTMLSTSGSQQLVYSTAPPYLFIANI